MGVFRAAGKLDVTWDRPIPLYWPGETVEGTATFTPKDTITVN
ncbi:hypothetical protein KIPB_011011, partial [Kipferlia bialata]|eukprot:g11011.t1